MSIDLRLGTWQEALADVGEVDAVITDPPYSQRTHSGQQHAVRDTDRYRARPAQFVSASGLGYEALDAEAVAGIVDAWAPRCRGWFVVLTSHDLVADWTAALASHGRYVFAPLAAMQTGRNVRLQGDGPASWSDYVVAARPRCLPWCKWGALPGGYVGEPLRGQTERIGGEKPLWLMQALVRDYSRPGDLVCDPFAGRATTLLAAAIEGRRAVGAEVNRSTHGLAVARIARGYTRTLVPHDPLEGAAQGGLFAGEG